MIFETHIPQVPIQAYIESIFHFKDFVPDHSIERVVPTGHIFILFELDGMTRNTFDNETLKPKQSFSKVWVSGMHRNYLSISAHPHSEMFVIQFKPFGAHPFFHFSIDELSEKVVPGEDVFGKEILNVKEDLMAGQTSTDKFVIAEKWLENKFDSTLSPPEELLSIIAQLQTKAGKPYSNMISEYPYTQKHLIDQFKKYIGLTPKYFQRILRFNEILQKTRNQETISWPQIAYELGFSDQSHFIKEFKYFSGFNPQDFIAQALHEEEPNFFPLDREG